MGKADSAVPFGGLVLTPDSPRSAAAVGGLVLAPDSPRSAGPAGDGHEAAGSVRLEICHDVSLGKLDTKTLTADLVAAGFAKSCVVLYKSR